MEAQMIYPTAPPGAHAEGVEHVESSGNPSGNPEGMMSKVKRKARKLRDRIKKVTGTDGTDNEHEDIKHEEELHQHAPGAEDEEVDEGAKSCEDDEEERDHVNPADNQLKHEQLHSIGKLVNQEGGPEVEVHGATPDTCSKSADNDVPISPYKNDGPADALQAVLTKHHNYDEPLFQLGGEEKTTKDTFGNNVVWPAEGSKPRGENQQPDSLGLPTLAEVKMATSPEGASRNSATSYMDVTYLEDLVKPNPEFQHSSSATYDKIGVVNENLPTDRKLDTSEDYSTKATQDLLEASAPEYAELSGYQSSASVPVKGNELIYMPVSEMSGHQSSAPMLIEANEEVERPVSNPDGESSLKPPPGILDEVVKELNGIDQVVGPGHSIDNNAVRAFENDLEYPSTKGTEDLSKASAPECAEVRGYQSSASAPVEGDELVYMPVSEWSGSQSSAPMPIKADEVVERPVSNADGGGSLTPPPGILDEVVKELNGIAQVVGPGHSIDNNAVQAFENDLEYPSTHGDVKSLSLEQSPLRETAEPEKNWSTNKHNEVKEEGSSLTSPPGIVDDITYKLNAVVQHYGTGESLDNKSSAFAKETDYPGTESKLIFDTAEGDVKSSSLEQSPLRETAEPEKNWSTNKHNEVKDEGSSLTSPPGIVDDITYKPNAVVQHYGTGESLDNKSSAFAKKTDYPGTESKLIFDTADGVENLSLAHGETAESEKNQKESWCKLSADKQNNAKGVVTTGLPGADNTSESETQQTDIDGWNNTAADGGDVAMRMGGGDRAPNLQDNEYADALSKPWFSEDVRRDVDEENFYDPNDNKDNQFQEGFALGSGNADEDDRKLQGLEDTVASTLGYGNESCHHTGGGEHEEENPYSKGEDAPTQQQTGFVRDSKDTVASTFGDGKEPADEFSHIDEGEQSHVAETEHKPEVDIDGRQPQTGVLQALKSVMASKLGYGTAGELPSQPSENLCNDNTPVQTIADAQPQYDDGGEHGGVVGKAGYESSVAEYDAPSENMHTHNTPVETTVDAQLPYDDGGVGKAGYASSAAEDVAGEPHSPRPTGFFQGMKNMIASTLGYNKGSEGAHTTETGHTTHDEVPLSST